LRGEATVELNQNQKIALAVLIGLAIVGFGLWGKGRDSGVNSGITITQPMDDTAGGETDPAMDAGALPGAPQAASTPVVVHVAGEVNKPDVYTLPSGSRVIDAIKKAGGATSAGSLDSLNLAARVKDGEKICVPSKLQSVTISIAPPQQAGQPAAPQRVDLPGMTPTAASIPSSSQPTSSAGSTSKFKNPGDGVVNVNTADAAELQRLPGVGPSTAQKILEYRAQIGRFSLPDQMMDVKGIGPKKFERMRPFISL
jgi:competence protein ComEA